MTPDQLDGMLPDPIDTIAQGLYAELCPHGSWGSTLPGTQDWYRRAVRFVVERVPASGTEPQRVVPEVSPETPAKEPGQVAHDAHMALSIAAGTDHMRFKDWKWHSDGSKSHWASVASAVLEAAGVERLRSELANLRAELVLVNDRANTMQADRDEQKARADRAGAELAEERARSDKAFEMYQAGHCDYVQKLNRIAALEKAARGVLWAWDNRNDRMRSAVDFLRAALDAQPSGAPDLVNATQPNQDAEPEPECPQGNPDCKCTDAAHRALFTRYIPREPETTAGASSSSENQAAADDLYVADLYAAERRGMIAALEWAMSAQQVADWDVLAAKVAELKAVDASPSGEPACPTRGSDDPALDGTDGAHPAWWRGHDRAELEFRRREEASDVHTVALIVHDIHARFSEALRRGEPTDAMSNPQTNEADVIRSAAEFVRRVRKGMGL